MKKKLEDLEEIDVSSKEFKELKRDKVTTLFREGPMEMYEVERGDKVLIVDEETGKTKTRKVKRVKWAETVRECAEGISRSRLGLKWNEPRCARNLGAYLKACYVVTDGVVLIDFKRKFTFKRFMKYTFLIILLSITFISLRNVLINLNDDIVNERITRLTDMKQTYAFLNTDPPIVLTLRGDHIADVGCFDEECLDLEIEFFIIDKNFSDGIRFIFENARYLGLFSYKGITIEAYENIVMDEELDYITMKHITKDEVEERLKKVKRHATLVSSEYDGLVDDLWDELKKDYQYDKVYSCHKEDENLECHFRKEFLWPFESPLDDNKYVRNMRSLLLNRHYQIMNTLDKFNIPHTFDKKEWYGEVNNQILINDVRYKYELEYDYGQEHYKNVCSYSYRDTRKCNTSSGTCDFEYTQKIFSLLDLDLLNPGSILDELLVDEYWVREEK